MVPVIGPEPGQYEMAQCSHSGLERINNTLYTFEQDHIGLDRRLQRYGSYHAFVGWWLVAPTVALVLGTAGAYFAARYRPWLIVAVIPRRARSAMTHA